MPLSLLNRLFGKSESEWCCFGFQASYENAGQRGFAILVGRNSSGNPSFLIQFRAVEPGQEQSVNSELPMSVVAQTGLIFCPWCGENLDKRYGSRVDELFREGLEITY